MEMRPSEGGRNVVVRRTPDGAISDLIPKEFNARTRVHEYGGGDYVVHNSNLYFSNFGDQRLYRVRFAAGESQPEALTPAGETRYADAVVDEARNRLICVREDHRANDHEPANTIVSIDLSREDEGTVLASGSDFYSSPRISPDGRHLAWLSWNHPNMPWDGTELWVGELSDEGNVAHSTKVAGGPSESIFQPEWSPDGVLHFVSDRTGWWNLYKLEEGQQRNLYPIEAEFGLPQWVFGMLTYSFISADRILCAFNERGVFTLGILDSRMGELERLDTGFTDIFPVRSHEQYAVFRAGSPRAGSVIARMETTSGQIEVLRRSSNLEIDPGYLSEPQAIEFPTTNGQTAHGFFYPPKNRDFVAPEGELPPLLVKIHGGPTAATSTTLSLGVQYWTSRGFAVLDVNYGGSTGYGTEYRRRLNGQWGIVDVDDCANGACFLSERGLADSNRLAITGGSAGGYTTLAALTFRDVFRAGGSHYGVSDTAALARDTHKFESHYLDGLIGPYPERSDLYDERSPVKHTEQLSCPIIFFQGLEDKIVPPNQAEMMVDALRAKGLPVAYVAFEGEQHGFRRAENIKRALDGEFYFYSKIFGFEVADRIEPVPIENFPQSLGAH
jgi:dipeptidyl aminopeptidase/acylaminoacyl peptidase